MNPSYQLDLSKGGWYTELMSETTLEAPAPTTKPVATLLLQDRCDSCGAQAYVKATFANGELLFCGHHFKTNEEKITASALTVLDERFQLEDNRPMSGAI